MGHIYGTYLRSFFIGRKILIYFNDFYTWHLSISLQNRAQTIKMKKIKRGMCKSESIFHNLQSDMVFE